MDIVRVGTEVVSRQARDIGVVLILGGGDDLDVAVLCSLLGCLLGELTGNNVVSLAGAGEQVICYRGKLCGGSALEEEDLIVIGNAHDLAEISLSGLNYFLVVRRSMTHLHYGHTGVAVANKLGCGTLENRKRKHRRSCGKIVDSVHSSDHSFSVKYNTYYNIYLRISQ